MPPPRCHRLKVGVITEPGAKVSDMEGTAGILNLATLNYKIRQMVVQGMNTGYPCQLNRRFALRAHEEGEPTMSANFRYANGRLMPSTFRQHHNTLKTPSPRMQADRSTA